MTNGIFALKGDIIFTPKAGEAEIHYDSYLVCRAGRVAGVFPRLPEWFGGEEVFDYTGKLIIPGLVDLHLHAAQYGVRGYGFDLTLADWQNNFALPEEYCFEFPEHAEKMYDLFADELLRSATTRACVFASNHTEPTLSLMKKLEERGLRCYVGKACMDTNYPEYYTETTEGSIAETRRWLEKSKEFKKVKPILSPTSTSTVSGELMAELGRMRDEYYLPVQSHLSETVAEKALIKEMYPDCENGAEACAGHGMLGGVGGCVVAHCVHSDEKEIDAVKRAGAYIAHCPASNMNTGTGIAPVAKYLRDGLHVGLGTDLAGGVSLNMFTAMSEAIKASKIRSHYTDDGQEPLNLTEALYMATRGGGEFFGQVGSFEPGYELDAIVIDDRNIPGNGRTTLMQRLERFMYLSDGTVEAKFIRGNKVL